MKYHRGILLYTLAFEAEVHIQKQDEETVYKYDLVGPGPHSGGDTYNAVEAVDDEIYFGGWVHAPAVYRSGTEGRGDILFSNKFSHLHRYDAKQGTLKLLWSDSLKDQSRWAGEISQIVYDPIGDKLLVARGDGHDHLGVFAIDRRTGIEERLSETPALKGALHMDHICFDVRSDWTKGVQGVQSLDLVTRRWSTAGVDFSRDSVDGGGTYWPGVGCSLSAYARLFLFVRGGVLVGDPLGNLEGMRFVRLFDFGTDYSPSRTVCKPIGGGILVCFNAHSQSVLRPRGEFDARMKAKANFVNGPSVLLYITPPQVRIVTALGGRVTSFEKVADKLLVAGSTAANLGGDDSTMVDTGHRDLSVLDVGSVLMNNPPVTFKALGEHVMDAPWGGIPLFGRREAELRISSRKENALRVYEYDLGLPVQQARMERTPVKEGQQVCDLSGYRNIVSFRFERADPDAKLEIHLR